MHKLPPTRSGLLARRVAAVAMAAGIAGSAALASPAAAGGAAWSNPGCGTVDSPGSVTFTNNDGNTLRSTSGAIAPVTYTSALAALDTPDTLIAVQEKTGSFGSPGGRTLLRSTDAGCTWSALATLPSGWHLEATAAPGGRAYIWPSGDADFLYRVDGTTVTTQPFSRKVGFGVDPNDADHLFTADETGQIMESHDAGATWAARGAVIPGAYLYRIEFDPRDPLHAVAGDGSNGAHVTFDGGVTWSRATGVDVTPEGRLGANVFRVAISPADPRVVYAQGIDLDQNNAGHPSEGRHVYRSTDGGLTYQPIVDHVPGVITLVNGPVLAPSPVDPGVLYFEFGTNFAGYGTDIYRYSAKTGKVTWTHNAYDGVNAIVFHPARPQVMYFGLSDEP